jgi:hypothetical protein
MSEMTPQAAAGAIVIDEHNVVRIWLQEQVNRLALTPQEANKKLQEYESTGKLWIDPMKDGLGNARLVYILAKDIKQWWGARVRFIKGKAGTDLVIIDGWPNARSLLTAARYRVTHIKMIELQIGRPGIMAGAKASARFGLWLVCAVDVADYFIDDKKTLGQLLGSLTVDVPSVIIATAAGAAVGAALVGTVIGTIACGPFLIAFAVTVCVGIMLYEIDRYFGLSEKLGVMYDDGLAKWAQVRTELGTESAQLISRFENSDAVLDLTWDAVELARKMQDEFGQVGSYITSHLP